MHARWYKFSNIIPHFCLARRVNKKLKTESKKEEDTLKVYTKAGSLKIAVQSF